ncbi:hypothetical protein FSP39_002864 [Pinctada imbricata]|uniref:C1q domain-containing protein n=1 Tax=Pinctada imbricata TaxID=66713 RepID=A0AA88YFG4_PINIB|nr:hypothetical protein FSP39_002864 [Pinctada imbricata]
MVGFTACHTTGETLGKGQTVIYDHVITNIGNAYDVRDGEFNVPYNGLYILSVKLVAYFNTEMYVQLTRNGMNVHQIYSNGDRADSSTLTLNLYLQASDIIVIKSERAGDRLHPYEYNCFSGMLVRE